MRTPTPEQALAAMERVAPYLGRYSSAWCRKLLYSTLHHTARTFDQAALEHAQLSPWLCHEPWPKTSLVDLYNRANWHWCEECLSCGYHSYAHQLVGLSHCPLHDLPMRQGCPQCEFSVLIRSKHSAESPAPFRNCLHCHQPLLRLTDSPKWPKTAKFLAIEHQALRRLRAWGERVSRLHARVYLHSEGAPASGAHWPREDHYRLAVETIHPLPPNVRVAPVRPGLRLTTLVLDRHRLREPVVPSEVMAQVGVSMIEHLGQGPVPTKWFADWRTGKAESPVPARAGESSHFDFWKMQVLPMSDYFSPPHPTQTLRPCMLGLVAARVVGHFDEFARSTSYGSIADPAFSIFFTDLDGAVAKPPLGDYPGIIVEMHHTLGPAAYASAAVKIEPPDVPSALTPAAPPTESGRPPSKRSPTKATRPALTLPPKST